MPRYGYVTEGGRKQGVNAGIDEMVRNRFLLPEYAAVLTAEEMSAPPY